MHIVHMPSSAKAIARTLARPLGFVPTMGALHRGHIALIERAREENAAVVASIFVNPLQFAPGEDYEAYPRAFEHDVTMFRDAGVDMVYVPRVEGMYPPGFRTHVDVQGIGSVFEGATRPGHFTGVATVVLKLLHALEPTTLYIGQKDAQQSAVIRSLIRDLDMGIGVTVCPTVRETDGLALSSRNVYLDPQTRRVASSLYRALLAVGFAIEQGRTNRAFVLTVGKERLEKPLELEYLEIVDPQTFEVQTEIERPALIIAAARAGRIRLIDNLGICGDDGCDPIVTPRIDVAVRMPGRS